MHASVKEVISMNENELTPVDSTAVQSAGWRQSVMYVKFHSNPVVYFYPGVPFEVFTQFMNSPSKGQAMKKIQEQYSINKK